MAVKIHSVCQSVYVKDPYISNSIHQQSFTVITQDAIIPPDPIEISIRTAKVIAYLSGTTTIPKIHRSTLTVYLEQLLNLDVYQTEHEHIVHAVDHIWDNDGVGVTADMFSIVDVQDYASVSTNSTVTIDSEPAAPSVGDIELRYNRINTDITIKLTKPLDHSVGNLPMFRTMDITVLDTTDDFIQLRVNEDSVLCKANVIITLILHKK